MNSERQLEIYKQVDEKILAVTKSKRYDYANEDVLSNFKGVSGAAKSLDIDITTATGYSLFMVLLKIARLSNLLNAEKTPNNESIEDSFLDGINYFKLAYCCYLDQNNEKS